MFSLSTAVANTMLNDLVAAANAGSGPAKLRFYDGAPPTNADTVLSSNNLLAECECADPCGTVADKTLTFATISPDADVDVTGIASFFRLTDSADTVVGQGSVSDNLGSGDIKLSSVSLTAEGTLTITAATLSL